MREPLPPPPSEYVGDALPGSGVAVVSAAAAAAVAAANGLSVGVLVAVAVGMGVVLGLAFLWWDFLGDGVSEAPLFLPALFGRGGLPSHACCLAVASFFARSCRRVGSARRGPTHVKKQKRHALERQTKKQYLVVANTNFARWYEGNERAKVTIIIVL